MNYTFNLRESAESLFSGSVPLCICALRCFTGELSQVFASASLTQLATASVSDSSLPNCLLDDDGAGANRISTTSSLGWREMKWRIQEDRLREHFGV